MKNIKSKPKNLISSTVIAIVVISLVVCILLLVKRIYAPGVSDTSADGLKPEASETSAAFSEDSVLATESSKIKAEHESEKAFYRKKLSKIVRNFTFAKDDFQDKGWYMHRNFGKKTSGRTTLKAHVREDGFIYLESQWYGKDWIFHSHIKVKVGQLLLSSPKVESYNKYNKQQYSGDTFWENVYYLESGDNGIIQAIADSTAKPVKVRFEGRKFHRDTYLTPEEKQSIRESHELSEVLKKINL